MMYAEFLALTDGKATYEQFLDIESAYMAKESMTKKQAATLWKRRYRQKEKKPIPEYLKAIKKAIKDLQGDRDYAEYDELQIRKRYDEKIVEYDPEDWTNQSVIKSLNQQRDNEIYRMWENYGNDATIHIIYTDGSECIASGTEIVSGDVVPKMQHIAYATYEDGWIEYDTLTGLLSDNDFCLFGDLGTDEGIEAREQYFNNIEIMFNTEWGKHRTAQTGENQPKR